MIYYLSLGSNIGHLESNIQTAMKHIVAIGNTNVIKSSTIFRTKPWGHTEQDDFFNSVIEVFSWHEPATFFKHLREIEIQMGKITLFKWGPRIIDIDVLFCDSQIIKTKELTIPHPLLHEREFVLAPMSEIAPDFIHPIYGLSIKSLYEKLLKEENCQKSE